MPLTKEQADKIDVAGDAFMEVLRSVVPDGSPAITFFSGFIVLLHDDRDGAISEAGKLMAAIIGSVVQRTRLKLDASNRNN